jgi:hypothetical protein
MNERILYPKCPLCDCLTLIDSVTGNCSKHPLYHNSLNALMRWKQCADCGHIFTEGYYTDDICKLIYSKTNENQQVGFDIERQRITSSHMVEKVLPYVTEGNWLDVGFGNGSLLFTAQEYGFIPIGVDLRKDTVNKMSSLGIESYWVNITELTLNTKCSVISMADVLEHMPYPKDALRAAHGLLSDEGIIFISMPNIESIVWKALDQNNANPYWGEIEHYHNFSRTRLYRLLREFGFEPVRYGISERYRVCMEVLARKI